MMESCHDAPTFSRHIDHGKEASQLHSLLVNLLDKVDSKVLPVYVFPSNLKELLNNNNNNNNNNTNIRKVHSVNIKS